MMGRIDDDPQAARRFRALFDAHRDAVLGYALRRTADPADAADVVAETFLVAWRRLSDVPAGDARPWLFAVARRVLANQRRGEARRHRLAERLGHELVAQMPAGVDAAVPHGAVRAALAALPPGHREALLLVCWEGLTPAQVAASLGVPAVTVRSRLHRARHRLRAELDAAGAPDAPLAISYAKEDGR